VELCGPGEVETGGKGQRIWRFTLHLLAS